MVSILSSVALIASALVLVVLRSSSNSSDVVLSVDESVLVSLQVVQAAVQVLLVASKVRARLVPQISWGRQAATTRRANILC